MYEAMTRVETDDPKSSQLDPYSRGPSMAAMFLLVFWILFSGHDEAGLSPNTSFGAAEFLDSSLHGLIVLVACIWCRWLFVLD